MDDSYGRAVSRSELQNHIQHLQTVAIEASNQLRTQCIQVMQIQAIRLEDVAETEIEDICGLDSCMDELMLCVLYTELRKEVREVTDALVDQQYSLFSSRKRLARVSPIRAPAEGEEVSAGKQVDESDNDDNSPPPPPLSSGADTFMTARGMPMFSSAESPTSASASAAGDDDDGQSQNISADSGASDMAGLERRLYDVCIEVDEWRRTRHIQDFISDYNERAGSGGGGRRRQDSRTSSVRSAAMATRLPIEQLIDEARERHRMRASSLGNHATAGLLMPLRNAEPAAAAGLSSNLRLSASPPLSRLMQAEREAADLRNGSSGSSPRCPPTTEGALSPSGQQFQGQLSSLRLIGTTNDSSGGDRRHHTLVDDVRIIGWTTRGSGLDVHTEFKVVVHLTRGENLTVMRRYTDFALLRQVLCQRFYTFRKRIPHLPPKKAFGKFEDTFLRERESGLQFFLAYVMLHPAIGCSSIIKQWLQGSPPPPGQ
ncbi:hypothetical protein IWW38_000132 [Coemansia aciculifera]|uniref:Uncharacterized protein n=1 Tax=Coemansia aciculifera TaxID=417176 RepID=A0ACC1MB21_9FUNG|nr:hypothetical protein IWW38_000132 [Coemansia aciculifera]